MSIASAVRALKRTLRLTPPPRTSNGIVLGHYEDGLNFYLRDSDMAGCAEIVLTRNDGSHSIIPLSRHKVRAWNAKLANIISREA